MKHGGVSCRSLIPNIIIIIGWYKPHKSASNFKKNPNKISQRSDK